MLTYPTLGARAPRMPPQTYVAGELNKMADTVLYERVAAVLVSADDSGTARRPEVAPFVTTALALRIH